MAWESVLAFETDSTDFVLGFEAGCLWQRLRAEPVAVVATVHAKNAELIIRMSERTGRKVISEELGDEWIMVTFEAEFE